MGDTKQELIADYKAWVEEALNPLDDHIGIRDIAVKTFTSKLEKWEIEIKNRIFANN